MTNAQFYLARGVPLDGILVNVALFALEDRVHTGYDLLIGKIGELDVRIARLEERLSK